MVEASILAAWACVNSWCTPALLFVFLNLMIGTIAIASGFFSQKQNHENRQQPYLGRPPSFLERIKSFNYRSQDVTPEPQTHHLDVRDQHSESESEPESEIPFLNTQDRHVERTTSDTKPTSGNMPSKLAKKLRKSASVKSAFAHFGQKEEEQEEDVPVRPSTVREGKKEIRERFGDDEEVDAKADDFINKFKNQLKLQRLQSIIRYKEMLSRGTEQ